MSSSHDSPPSSRPSLSEPPQQDAISLFDLHLRFVTDSYLSFFQERKRIEEAYVEALLRLHRKVKTADLILDDPGRGDTSTTRAAWSEIRDNVAREADTRVAFLGTLYTDVISPLASLRETQDRIRKRIKEDLKDAISAHSDYADNVLPRLKRNYLKKCQDAEDYKAAAAAIPITSPTFPADTHNTVSTPKPNPNISARPIVTAPQPLRPLDRRPSVGGHPAHARSPSASAALQDQAHGAVKKGLNQLMTFLDKGGNMKDLSGRSDNALRSVRAKREADEADKEYRKAVHWLETLRLRRVKILESGYNSLEMFVRESAETVKYVLRRYTDNMVATAATQSQICEHGRRSIEKISSQRDVAVIESNIPRMLAAAVPRPVYYHNFNVGECKDLIFGVSLVDYATARNLAEGEVPKIVGICVREIERRGLDAEGIYRVSGRHAAVQDLQHKIERNEMAFTFNPAVDDVYAVASLLKQYLRELPEPLFKFPLNERLQHSEEIEEHRANDFQLIRGKMRRLPAVHQATLKMIIEHLARIASHQERNKMDAKNLAIVFGAVIFGEDEMPKGGDLLSVQSWKDTLAEDLILNAQTLFVSIGSPSLPPAPAGEPVPPVTYGSSHTKVGKMLPPPSPNRGARISRSPSLPPRPPPNFQPPLRSLPPEDFTPQLPPHPPSSIHPSLRAGPMSAMPARQSLPAQPRPAPVIDCQLTVDVSTPMVPRSVSRESRESKRTSKSTPRTPARELAPDEATLPRREGRLTPRTTPRLPELNLWNDDRGSSTTASSTVAEPVEDSNAQAQTIEAPSNSEEDDAPTSASSAMTFASARSSSSKGSASAPAPIVTPKSPGTSENVLPDASSVPLAVQLRPKTPSVGHG